MVLVNGADGIGTGWSTNINQYNPLDLIDIIKRKIRKEALPENLNIWYRGYTGGIEPIDKGGFQVKGTYNWDSDNSLLNITELPIKKWTKDYKDFLEKLLLEEDPPITDYQENHTK